MGLHLHLEVHAVDGQRGGGRNGGLRVRFLEVLHEGIVVGGLLPAQRAGVHEIRDGDRLGVGFGGRPEDRSDPEPRRPRREAGESADLEKITARYVLGHETLLLLSFHTSLASGRASAYPPLLHAWSSYVDKATGRQGKAPLRKGVRRGGILGNRVGGIAPRARRKRLDDAGVAQEGDRLHLGVHAKLAVDVRQVLLHRLARDEQLVG